MTTACMVDMSPSSRRAWIEIGACSTDAYRSNVALLAEGVDRNIVGIALSAAAKVALLAEGVDRNFPALERLLAASCRPPRGGRG